MNSTPVLTMDDVDLRTKQIALNLALISEGLSNEIPNKTGGKDQQGLVAMLMADRVWETYIPLLDFLADMLLDLSQKAEEGPPT